MRTEATWTQPREDCDTTRWHSPDEQASETEVSSFLAALCTLLRPRVVLETGTYLGHTAEAMARALVGYGHLDTIEKNPDYASRAKSALTGLPATIHNCDSLTFEPKDSLKYDLLFFDSDIQPREEEIRRFRRWASGRAIIALHDARHPRLREALEILDIEGVIGAFVYLPTPRGLALSRYA